MLRRRLLVIGSVAAPLAAAQPQQKPARIVVLSRSPADLRNLREGMRSIGHVEGSSYVFDERDSGGDSARLESVAMEAVRDRPDMIFAAQGEAARAAIRASATVPVVFNALDPVAEGLVDSLARPGRNATGLAGSYELGAKRLGVLRDALPALRRVAVLYADSRGGLGELEAIRAAAGRIAIEILPLLAFTATALAPAIEHAAGSGAEALMSISSAVYRTERAAIIAQAARHRLPAIYVDVDAVVAGGLMSYDADRQLSYRRVALQIDRILKGADPATIPVELPTRFELAINLRTAAALGLAIPPSMVALADRVIE